MLLVLRAARGCVLHPRFLLSVQFCFPMSERVFYFYFFNPIGWSKVLPVLPHGKGIALEFGR